MTTLLMFISWWWFLWGFIISYVFQPNNADASCLYTWWRHQMETFSALLAFCAGNSPVTGEFPAQRPVTRSFDVSLICAWINGWANSHMACDLRRHPAHCDVIVMVCNQRLLMKEILWRWYFFLDDTILHFHFRRNTLRLSWYAL